MSPAVKKKSSNYRRHCLSTQENSEDRIWQPVLYLIALPGAIVPNQFCFCLALPRFCCSLFQTSEGWLSELFNSSQYKGQNQSKCGLQIILCCIKWTNYGFSRTAPFRQIQLWWNQHKYNVKTTMMNVYLNLRHGYTVEDTWVGCIWPSFEQRTTTGCHRSPSGEETVVTQGPAIRYHNQSASDLIQLINRPLSSCSAPFTEQKLMRWFIKTCACLCAWCWLATTSLQNQCPPRYMMDRSAHTLV